MKRSEMIKYIYSNLSAASLIEYEGDVEEVLMLAEKAGMLPPPDCDPNDLIFPIQAYQWESEDETK